MDSLPARPRCGQAGEGRQAERLRRRARTLGARCAPVRRGGPSYQDGVRRNGRARSYTEHCAKHWGDSGGTPAGKDGEIRVRMGNSQFEPPHGRGATTGVFSREYVETKEVSVAPQVGFEPTTIRLTAEWPMAASRCKHQTYTREKRIFAEFWGTFGGPDQFGNAAPTVENWKIKG